MAKFKPYGKPTVTPAFQAFFPALNQPDDKYNKYKVGVVQEPNSDFVQDMKTLFEEKYKEWLKTEEGKEFKDRHTKVSFVSAQLDKDKKPTGYVIINVKSNDQPKFVDAHKAQIRGVPPVINGGATLKAAISPKFYTMPGDKVEVNGIPLPTKKVGMTFYLNAIQIIELNSMGGADLFEEEEGYAYDESDAPTAPPETSQESHEDDDF